MKKLDIKLTTIGVSLFVAFLLLIIGKGNNICQFFAFIIFAIDLVFVAKYIKDKAKKKIPIVEQELDELEELEQQSAEEMERYMALCHELKKLKTKTKKTEILFYVTALLFFVVGVIVIM